MNSKLTLAQRNHEWATWLDSPSGEYLRAWTLAQCDEKLADVFGFHAVQCAGDSFDCLRDNRMPYRCFCFLAEQPAQPLNHLGTYAKVHIDHFEALPFAAQSLDLLVLPYVLEFAEDAHQVLREAERVLRPEGHLFLLGLNPFSLWGARQALANLGLSSRFPANLNMLTLSRLRDWLALLNFDAEKTQFGLYRPLLRTEKGLHRTRFLESLGDRFWPVCGAAYSVMAVKKVAGMRVIGPARRSTEKALAAKPVVAQ